MKNDDLLMYRIGLTLIKGVGNNLAKNLIACIGNEEAIFKENRLNLEKVPGIGETISREIISSDVLKRAEMEVEFIHKHQIYSYYYSDADYPFRLKECYDAPLLLFSNRNIPFNSSKILAIVGTRNATPYGKEVTNNLISELSLKNPELVIVSGLAYGIDIQAHNSSLNNQLSTWGVVAHGLDRIYPADHRNMAIRMSEKGGIITEYISETNPDRQNFVQRNRIIAGISDAVVVVESSEKGGSLITAELANDYNRDVFAIPGRINDKWSKGCNQLIALNRAALFNSVDEMMKTMGWSTNQEVDLPRQMELFRNLNPDEQKVVELLKNNENGIQINQLSQLLKLQSSKTSAMLLEMEFAGILLALPGDIYKLRGRFY